MGEGRKAKGERHNDTLACLVRFGEAVSPRIDVKANSFRYFFLHSFRFTFNPQSSVKVVLNNRACI